MIQDKDTNAVYISKWLKEEHPQFFKRFTALMTEVGIRWDFLKYTNDYWARDYMPLQLSDGTFLKYKYYPDYLLKKQEDKETITNCSRACKCIGIDYKETDIIIDGGNMVDCGEYIVMTNKVFSENKREMYDKELAAELESLFGQKIIFIPWHATEDEPFGHADGFVKYAGEKQILMTNHSDAEPEEAAEIKNILENHGYNVTELKYNVKHPDADYNWGYINFLQVGNIIIMPTFGIDEDCQAKEQIQKAFPTCIIYEIEAREIADKGGAIHCITWNIKK